MFSILIGKLKLSTKYIKLMIIFVLISLLYALLLLTNISKVGISLDGVTKDFVVQYFISIGFCIVSMFLMIWLRKEMLKGKPLIEDSLSYISAIRAALIDKGLYDELKNEYLLKKNKELKLDKYRNMILDKRDKAERKAATIVGAIAALPFLQKVLNPIQKRKKELAEKYDKLYKESSIEGFSIDDKNIKIRELDVNTLFLGFKDKASGNGVKIHYSGVEGFIAKVIPSMMFGIMFTFLILLITSVPKESSLETWKNTLTVISMSISYMLIGGSFAEHSINNVYYGVLSSRADIAKSFLAKKGLIALVGDNPTYKYKVELEKEVDNGKNDK